MILEDKDLCKITGGSITASLVGEFIKGLSVIIDIGRMLGSAIRRITSNRQCDF